MYSKEFGEELEAAIKEDEEREERLRKLGEFILQRLAYCPVSGLTVTWLVHAAYCNGILPDEELESCDVMQAAASRLLRAGAIEPTCGSYRLATNEEAKAEAANMVDGWKFLRWLDQNYGFHTAGLVDDDIRDEILQAYRKHTVEGGE